MFGIHKIGLGELILILGIVLVIFGPSKLPEIGKSMGQAVKEFRTGVNKQDNSTENESKSE